MYEDTLILSLLIRLIAKEWLFVGLCEKLEAWCSSCAISGCVFTAKYISIPKIELYSHSSLNAGRLRSSHIGSPVVGIYTPLALAIPFFCKARLGEIKLIGTHFSVIMTSPRYWNEWLTFLIVPRVWWLFLVFLPLN